ncbi:MAG: hypothetical protein NTY74_16290 [Ignavibacteriae bacterium]|nr:hypothetical protein [Ignavibacteriota bacterium]
MDKFETFLKSFLKDLESEEYFDLFWKNDIKNIEDFKKLKIHELEEIGIKSVGHQKLILLAIKNLKDNAIYKSIYEAKPKNNRIINEEQNTSNINHNLELQNIFETFLINFLKDLESIEYFDLFWNNNIKDIEVFKKLTIQDLKTIGISSIGHQRLIKQAISELDNNFIYNSTYGVAHEDKKVGHRHIDTNSQQDTKNVKSSGNSKTHPNHSEHSESNLIKQNPKKEILRKNNNKGLLIAVALVIMILIVIILKVSPLGFKSNYEKGVELIKERRYDLAIESLQKIKVDDDDYKKAKLKINLANGLQSFEANNWVKSFSYFLNELLPEDSGIATEYIEKTKKGYLKDKGLNELNFSFETISVVYSGIFTKGGEVKASIKNNIDKDLLIKYSLTFQLLRDTKNGYKLSTNNPNKTVMFSPKFEGELNATSEIQVNNNSTVQFMVNFDDINESSSNPVNFINLFEGVNLDYNNDKIVLPLKNNEWLLIPITAFKIKQTSSKNEEAKNEYFSFDLTKYTEIKNIDRKEDYYLINGKEKLKKKDVKLSTYGSIIDSKTFCDTSKIFKLTVPYAIWKDNSTFILKKNKKDKLQNSDKYNENVDYYGYELSIGRPNILNPNILSTLNNSPSDYKVCSLYKITEINNEYSDYSDFMCQVESIIVEMFVLDKESNIIYRSSK